LIWANLSVFFYVFLGLFYLMKIGQTLFSEKNLLLLLIALLLATNLYYFTAYNSPMSHGYLFSLYAFLMYGTMRFYELPKLRFALLIGLSAGMITLIRPVEIFCLFIPLFYGIKSLATRFQFVLSHWKLYLSAVFIYAIPGLFQMLYWKTVSGNWLFYSYGNESFDFLHPQIWNGLTSFQNGWLIYTPIMVFALAGIAFLYKKSAWFWPIILFLPIHIYIAYSWWCWYYINGFGSRPMVETYALLFIPLGYSFIQFQKRKWSKYLLLTLILGLSILNIFQTYQFTKGVMWSETSSKAYYVSTFGKTSLNYQDLVNYDSNEPQPDTTNLLKVKDLYFNNYEDSLDINFQNEIVYRGNFSYKLTKEKQFSTGFIAKLQEIGAQKDDYFRISSWCYKEFKESTWWTMSMLIGNLNEGDKITRYRNTRIGNKINNTALSLWGGKAKEWGEVVFFFKNTGKQTPNTLFNAFVQNGAGHPVYIDDFKVELWRKK
ncbi:MAG: hypothetical protein ACJAVF_004133, partial [Paraglaciecola sp.]